MHSMLRSARLFRNKSFQNSLRITQKNFNCNGSRDSTKIDFQSVYQSTKDLFKSTNMPKDINIHGVFACNELNLAEVEVYGFDYDYTLAQYMPTLHDLIYNLGRDILISNLKYPKAISKLEYQPKFAIRGLHYDIVKGLLMKLDSFLQIETDSVYRGLTKISEDELFKLYENRKLPIAYVEGQSKSYHQKGNARMVQIADSFAVPEMCLLCNVAEYFETQNIAYNPEILFYDIKTSVHACHAKMHETVMRQTDFYIKKNLILPKFLEKLNNAGKKLFLVTNSPFCFVNQGMTFLAGQDWRDYFDVIIVRARKPKFFTDETRPIRIFDEKSNTHLWDRVLKLEKGKVYYEGTVKQFQELTGWRGHNVLYFGDHPYSDLADVTLAQGWRTGAIIHEIKHEIETLNKENYKIDIHWLQMLTNLIENSYDIENDIAQENVRKWMNERDQLRQKTKKAFNEQFGSVFRTDYSGSYFSRRLFRFADIYTSEITNLYNYSTNHRFYPRQGAMPHEYIYDFI